MKYNDVIQGGANRVMELIERQADHRRDLERASVYGDLWLRKVGLVGALFLSTVAIVGGMLLTLDGKSIGALGPLLTGIAVLAGVFVYWRRTQMEESPPQLPPGQGSPSVPPPDETPAAQ